MTSQENVHFSYHGLVSECCCRQGEDDGDVDAGLLFFRIPKKSVEVIKQSPIIHHNMSAIIIHSYDRGQEQGCTSEKDSEQTDPVS